MDIIEIGGGENPKYRPNIDLRKLPTVDIIHDITVFPWPLAMDKYDVVYSAHCIEHVVVKQVPYVLHEILRILKPGGHLELRVPDLERS